MSGRLVEQRISRLVPPAIVHDVFVDEITERFVAPFYLEVLHANLLRLEAGGRASLLNGMRSAARMVTL
jgi:hypothetical protein